MVNLPEALINLNGEFTDSQNAWVSAYDRSYLYGDSLYEVVRTYDQKPFGVKEHLKRLQQSALLCHLKMSFSLEFIEKEIHRSIDQFFENRKKQNKPLGEAYCRLVISRGAGKIFFGLSGIQTETLYTLYVQPLEEPSSSDFEKGTHLFIPKRIRNHPNAIDPAMKSGNYLNNLLAFLEAQEQGCDDAILKNHEDFFTEGTTFNLGYIRNGILATSPLEIGILAGITRKILIKSAEQLNIPVRIVYFNEKQLLNADEIFVMSTIKEIFPVTKINSKLVGHSSHRGKVGPLTRKLKSAFAHERKKWQ